jgi:hypothetical protein
MYVYGTNEDHALSVGDRLIFNRTSNTFRFARADGEKLMFYVEQAILRIGQIECILKGSSKELADQVDAIADLIAQTKGYHAQLSASSAVEREYKFIK